VKEGDSNIPGCKGSAEERWVLNTKEYHERYLEAMYERDERLRHLYITSIRFLAETLWSRGVKKLCIRYPIMLSQNNGNEYNSITLTYSGIGG
jgi:hypothetical protein